MKDCGRGRRGWALFWALGLVLSSGCGSDEFDWRLRFQSTDAAARAVTIQATIASGGCGGPIVYDETFPIDGSPDRSPPDLEPGVYGLSAIATDSTCAPVANGCTAIEIPLKSTREVVVPLWPSTSVPQCSVPECVLGMCVVPDAGVDSGPGDCEEDLQCNDGLGCTVDRCLGGMCVFTSSCPDGQACFGDACRCGTGSEICSNGADDDCDGAVDCVDTDCIGAPCGPSGAMCSGTSCACPGGAFENRCGDGIDDDCDGALDCRDADCDGSRCAEGRTCSTGECLCESTFEYCNDAIDNDCDGMIDCDDSECGSSTACNGVCIPSCTAVEYCALDACEGVGTCTARPSGCDPGSSPTCACNGVTYDSPVRNMAGGARRAACGSLRLNPARR